jgi:tetratricopeptide (TPR) repeat protein
MVSLPRCAAVCSATVWLAAFGTPSFVTSGEGATHAQSTKQAPLDRELSASPLESRLLTDAADGRWDEHSLFIAAQIAGGITSDAELLAASLDYAKLVDDLRSHLSLSLSGEDRAAAVLSFLHRQLLSGGYDLNATTLREAFASGRFNCVSATVLYNCLAAEAGLKVQPLRLPQHTCSLLLDSDRRVRVEATSPDWFEARHRPVAIHEKDEPFRPAEVDDGIPISDVALVAMIYYNRGVEALRCNQLKEAIRLNRLALALDPQNTQARGNLLSAINKRAIELTAQRRFEAAIAMVDHGLSLDPSHSPLRQNREFIEHARQRSAHHASR